MAEPVRIPLSRPSIDDADIAAVVEVLRSGTLSLGPKTREFEQAVAASCGMPYGIAVNSGTSGLHIALAALGIGPGDEVVTSPFSFVASANCAIYLGATPVFADIDPVTLTLDPAQVAAAITPRTRALVPVDVFGQPADWPALVALAERANLAVVADACEAIGAERNGQRVGSWGDAAVFAFYPNKQMTTGEGGVIVTRDETLAATMRSLINQGRDDAGTWMRHVRVGYNYRLDEMSAALGLSQIGRLDALLARRDRVAGWYTDRLQDVPRVQTPTIAPATTRTSWFVYVVRFAADVDRDRMIALLEADGIPARPYFSPIHLQPIYRQRFGWQEGDFPVTEAISRTTLALPFHSDMPETDVAYVCDRLAHHLGRGSAA